MIAVALHHARNMPFRIGQHARHAIHIVARRVPLIESFVPDEEAHAVAQVKQLGGRRIMAGTHGIGPHVFHDFQFALHGAQVECRAQRAQIVM